MNEFTPLSINGFVTRPALERAGVTDRSIRLARDAGSLRSIRAGWYALPDADPRVVRAVRIGGRLTGSSALALRDLWVAPDPVLHVAMPHNAARMRCPDEPGRPWDPHNHPDIRLQWANYPWGERVGDPVTALGTSLATLIRSSDSDLALTTVDSALNSSVDGHRVLTMRELRSILDAVPAKYRAIGERADARAQSGLETLARVRLRRLGIRVRIQVKIDRVGRVDVLVGDRFVLELDSRTHHLGEQYEEDRRRDLELLAHGFIVLRVSYRRVMYDWASIEETILAVVRRRDHLRDARHERLGLARTAGDSGATGGATRVLGYTPQRA